MMRLHLANNDLDWLPPGYRRLRGAIIGGAWTIVGAALATVVFVPALHLPFLSYFAVFVGTSAYWVGDGVSKRVISKRLGKLASGDVDLARLSNSDDGDLVHLCGEVRAQETVDSRNGGAPGVYRRVRVWLGKLQAIEEVGVDFQLVDKDGNAIGIEVERARWIVHDGNRKKALWKDLARFEALPAIAYVTARGLRATERIYSTETMLCVGDEVEVVGYKSRQVDPTMADRMLRETPMRATLRGGKDLPLLLSRVREAA